MRGFDSFKVVDWIGIGGWMLSVESMIERIVGNARTVHIVARPEVEPSKSTLAQS